MKGNRLQIRLDGPFFAASLGNSSTIALRNRQKLSSPSRIFASILQVRQAPRTFLPRLCAGLCFLGLLSSCSQAPSPALSQDAYVWQRHWTPAVSDAVRSRELPLDGLRVLALQWIGERVVQTQPDLPTLAARGLPLRLVLRIEGSRPRLAPATVATAIRTVLVEWRAQGLSVAGIEIDHDCASAALEDYADWLSRLKAELPNGIALSVTALPSWLDNPDGLRALRQVADESVLQVHAVEADQAHLFDPNSALHWIAGWQQHGDKTFRVALPAYRLRVRSGADGRPLAVDGEGLGELSGSAATERYAIPAEVARVVHLIGHDAPSAMRGWVWFRLPVASDRLGWAPATLAHAMRGEMPNAQIELQAIQRTKGLFDLFLHNADRIDGLSPTTISLPADCGLVEGHADFSATPFLPQLSAPRPQWLAPDQRVAIGFARCSRPLPERSGV
ncbi:MAG TPA: DUF3142 domain-containing protein [Aquimonas sp.]|nr:DUF3142 domain-containing protein [Aquimonas sp.]